MNKKLLSVIIGIAAIGIGIGYILAAVGVLTSFTVFIPGWWTAFLIIPGVVMLFSRGSKKFFPLSRKNVYK